MVAQSGALNPSERLAIYQRSYHARLINCFRSLFPSLLFTLGRELFDHFATDFLTSCPPTDNTLSRIAHGFAEHLANTRPDADSNPEDRETWPDFIIELATLEQAFTEVYNGEGLEGNSASSVLHGFEVAMMHPDQVLRLPFKFAPCLKLFQFKYPIPEYFRAARREENPELPKPAPSFVVMTRKDYQVKLYDLTSREFLWLEALQNDKPLNLEGKEKMLFRQSMVNWAEQHFFVFKG